MFPPPTRTTVISDCELEPIHLCGSIQPHGELLAIDSATAEVKFVSANIGTLFDLTCESLGTALTPEKLSEILHQSHSYSHQGLTIVEGETTPHGQGQLTVFLKHLDALSSCADLNDLLNRITVAVQKLTGYQRIMLYRFESDWSGTVIAETVEGDYDSFLDLRFPAEDIPKQARDLYALNPVRYIPDVDYVPVDLYSQIRDAELDLSLSSLRGVSKIHLEYLRNMSVGASMSISIVVGGKLWGLIACHNRTAKHLGSDVRQFCHTLSLLCSELIATRIASVQQADKARARTMQLNLIDLLSHHNDPVHGLTKNKQKVLDLTSADGAAIWTEGEAIAIGTCPSESDQNKLVSQLQRFQFRDAFCTPDVSKILPNCSEEFLNIASGILAVPIAKNFSKWLIFYRKGIVSQVQWAGEPIKTTDADQRLHPRQSFKKWQEIVHGKSQEWSIAQQESARVLGSYLQQRIEALGQLRAAIDAAQQAVLLIDQNEVVKYSNNRAAILFAKEEEELIGLTLTQFLPDGVSTKKLLTKGHDGTEVELFIDVNVTPVTTPEGLFSFVSIADVSSKVVFEQERQRLTAELKASNSAMQQFLEIIAHDLRSPILAIRNLAEWIETDSGQSLDTQSKAHLKTLRERANNMSAQLTSLLDFSKAGILRSQPEEVNTLELVNEIIDSLPALKNYQIEVGDLPTLLTARPPLAHVLKNLLENAGKYGGPPGSQISISARDDGDWYHFSVTDHGVGIPPEYLDEIFFPLRKLSKSDPDSHGMGLAFVKKIVEQCGGTVSVAAELGKGSTFSFTWKKDWYSVTRK